ncbi:hypothetical protein CY34DRAFT_807837 [Suillus luteus UH-Slu-Lm8-n1]|uniref:Uncharacterized protein n=1 Tax=Suillus luteus UH-Slu-Lm8-n1 TaxID=930992 RepID=A0A0D0ADQ8_9AGAM|nr:hypothetical protein CY34DRAFT_807837 [Suillus luteus UH-Slu-Lm8-n1]
MQNPEPFPWVTTPFPMTPPGKEIARTNDLSFKVCMVRVTFGGLISHGRKFGPAV